MKIEKKNKNKILKYFFFIQNILVLVFLHYYKDINTINKH